MFGKCDYARYKISGKVAATATSWLDLYPAIPTIHKPSTRDAKLVTRLEALKQILENDIKPNIEIRAYFVRLYRRGTKVCFLGSATNSTTTACGSTCSLLSPFNPLGTVPYMKTAWRQQASESMTLYYRIVDQIKEKGEHAGASQIKKWEKVVEILRKDALNWSEIKEENGWTKTADHSRARTVVDLNWTFEGAWCTRRASLEDIGPDEV